MPSPRLSFRHNSALPRRVSVRGLLVPSHPPAKGGLRSAERPRPIFSGQPLGAPLRRYILAPSPRLPPLPRDAYSARQRWTRAFQPGPGADEPLRWSVTPATKRETTLSQMRSQARFAVLLRRRTPRPEITDGLQLASSLERDGVSLMQVAGAGINSAVGWAKRSVPTITPRGQRQTVVHPTALPALETALRPASRTRRPWPPARRSCRSRRCGRDRTPGCAWRS